MVSTHPKGLTRFVEWANANFKPFDNNIIGTEGSRSKRKICHCIFQLMLVAFDKNDKTSFDEKFFFFQHAHFCFFLIWGDICFKY